MIYSNADIVSAPVIGELFPKAPSDATTVLGYLPWYTTLWFELATRWVPFHRQLWEVGPWLVSIGGIVLVAWSTAKAAGRWAGLFVAFVLVCAGDRLLPIQFGSDLHGATAVYVCLLDAYLVLLVTRGGRIGGPVTHVALCGVVAALTAAGLASDNLLIPAGLAPFLTAAVTQLWWAPRPVGRRIAISSFAIGVAAAIGAAIAVEAMHRVHVYAAETTIVFVGWNELVDHVTELVQSLADLFNGDFGGAAIGARSLLAFACAVAVVAGLVAAWRLGREQLGRLRAGGPPITAVREAHVTFWLLALALPAAAFVLSGFGQIGGARYLVASGYGIVVLAAVALAPRGHLARAVGVVAASLVVTASVVALASGDIRANSGHYPRQDFARFLTTFTQGEGLKYGYASYWVAAALTWETSTRIEVYPVLPCSSPGGLCTYPLHVITSWYLPRARTRTFVVLDPRYGPTPADLHFGNTVEVASYGEYKIYVYDYDVAANLGDWRRYGVAAS